MDEFQAAITVTTDSARGVRTRLIFFLILGVLVAGLLVWAAFALGEKANAKDVPFLVLSVVLAVGLGLSHSVLHARGAWTLDKQGIEHRSAFGRTTRIDWDWVDRIWPETTWLHLAAGGTRICLHYHLLDKEDAEAARGMVASHLGAAFNLTPWSTWNGRPRGESAVRIARLSAIGLAAGLTWLGIFLTIVRSASLSDGTRAILACVWAGPGLILGLAPVGIEVHLQQSRIAPGYPWRTRNPGKISKPTANLEQNLA